jgi:hypothetical protein
VMRVVKPTMFLCSTAEGCWRIEQMALVWLLRAEQRMRNLGHDYVRACFEYADGFRYQASLNEPLPMEIVRDKPFYFSRWLDGVAVYRQKTW